MQWSSCTTACPAKHQNSRQCSYVLLTLALITNCIITYPLDLFILILKPERINEVYGPDSEGRCILGCMYFAIPVMSILTLWKRYNPLELSVPLFIVQIVYKVVSAMVVEIQNPVSCFSFLVKPSVSLVESTVRNDADVDANRLIFGQKRERNTTQDQTRNQKEPTKDIGLVGTRSNELRKLGRMLRRTTVLMIIGNLSACWALSNRNNVDRQRRIFLWKTGGATSLLLLLPNSPANAGEVGARITKAITESGLGISVRRSIVQGAQVMDKLDYTAERLSDQFGLGSERSKQAKKPEPKVIPDFQPLDTTVATQILDISDQVFCETLGVKRALLQRTIESETAKVEPSFARSGLAVSADNIGITNQEMFNFRAFVHYKAYSVLLLNDNRMGLDFVKFKSQFEQKLGAKLCSILVPNMSTILKGDTTRDSLVESLNAALDRIRSLTDALVSRGLVAAIDISKIESEDVKDWSNDLTILAFSIALDGDATMQSQVLLQETGYRLYPSVARVCIQYILNDSIANQKIEVDDYYMDTDYNSDPNKFEVKEVLLNIVLDGL